MFPLIHFPPPSLLLPGTMGGLFLDGEESPALEDISKWTVEDVCSFVGSLSGCAEYIQVKTQEGSLNSNTHLLCGFFGPRGTPWLVVQGTPGHICQWWSFWPKGYLSRPRVLLSTSARGQGFLLFFGYLSRPEVLLATSTRVIHLLSPSQEDPGLLYKRAVVEGQSWS